MMNTKYLTAIVQKNISYIHGMFVQKGDLIGFVGPRNVYGVFNNPYKDENGNPTNGATTGSHLHFSIKLKSENTFVNPLDYINLPK